MSERTLFRLESEQARATSWLGRIVLIRPLSFTFLTIAALGVAIALGTFFLFGEYTRKSRVTGVLAPAQGVVKIIAPQSGIVEAVHALEGEVIEKDASVLILADGRSNRAREDAGAAVAARLDARRRALESQRGHALVAMRSEQAAFAERRRGLAREIENIGQEMTVQSERASLADLGLERARRLERIGFLSPAMREREEEGTLDQAGRLESLRRTRMSLSREISALDFELATARARAEAQLSSIDLQLAALDQERLERDLQYHATIVASTAGTVAAVLVERGQMVTAGTTLATMIPAGATLEAHLFSPSRSIGFVRDGQPVLLRYLAYPHQKFGSHRARVTSVSKNPLLPSELGFTPPDGVREPLYRIKVALESETIAAYGRPASLQAGMQVEADILLDRRRLIEWIFEPLLSLAGRA